MTDLTFGRHFAVDLQPFILFIGDGQDSAVFKSIGEGKSGAATVEVKEQAPFAIGGAECGGSLISACLQGLHGLVEGFHPGERTGYAGTLYQYDMRRSALAF